MADLSIPTKFIVEIMHRNGLLPIRTHMERSLRSIQNINKNFESESLNQIQRNNFSSTIVYDRTPQKICKPRLELLNGKSQVYFHEPFLAFLWCLTYYTIVLTDIQEQSINDPDIYTSSNPRLKVADELKEYGLLLWDYWKQWPSHLPNPENNRDSYCEIADEIYLNAVNFIFAHEFGHQYFNHLLFKTKKVINSKISKLFELQADEFAAKNIKTSLKSDNNIGISLAKKFGVIISFGSMIIPKFNLSGGNTHPDSDVRMNEVIHLLNEDDDDHLWVMGSLIFAIWTSNHNIVINFPEDYKTYRQQYEEIYELIQKRKENAHLW